MLLEYADRGSLEQAIQARRFYKRSDASLDLVSRWLFPSATKADSRLSFAPLPPRCMCASSSMCHSSPVSRCCH